MESLIIVVHVLAAIGIIGLVLIQHGKGADMGASFGSGASQTIFGSVGTGNVLTKSTTWLATVFFITSLVLALFARQQASQSIQDNSLIENIDQLSELTTTPAPVEQDIPVVPGDAAASDVPQAAVSEEVLQAAVDALEQAQNEAEAAEATVTEPADPAAAETQVEDAAGTPPAEAP